MYCGADSRIFLPRSSIHVYCLQDTKQNKTKITLEQEKKMSVFMCTSFLKKKKSL